MAKEMVTFGDIVESIREAISVSPSDTTALNKIKRQVNLYYLNEVIPFKRWVWLEKSIQVTHKAAYGAGTVSLTPGVSTATLSVAPDVSLGSFKGMRFSVHNSYEIYTIASHTTGSTAVTLNRPYAEELNAAATYKIWKDNIDLPINAKETTEIWHSQRSIPLDAVGPQGFRKLEAANPKAEGAPSTYNTHDFFDPSDTTDEYESDRYRRVRIYPSIIQSPLTINIDYIEEAAALEDDFDEPVIPIGDRVVLYYGAAAECWSIIRQNEDMADRWRIKANAKLARMAGERDEGMDQPSLSPKSGYLNNIRNSGLRTRVVGTPTFNGQTSYNSPTYAKNIRLDGGSITANFTVTDGVTIDGRDISEDGELLEQLAEVASVTLVDNTVNGVAATWIIASEADTVHLQYSVRRGTALMAGSVILVSDGSAVAIAENAAETAATGVSFSADVSGGAIRLLYTTTSTGQDGIMKVRSFNWLT